MGDRFQQPEVSAAYRKVNVHFETRPVGKRSRRAKRKPFIDEGLATARQEVEQQLRDPESELRNHLKSSYGVINVAVTLPRFSMTVIFTLLSPSVVPFTDDVKQGKIASLIARHAKKRLAGFQSWELNARVSSLDSNDDYDVDGDPDDVDGCLSQVKHSEAVVSDDVGITTEQRLPAHIEKPLGALGGDQPSPPRSLGGACAVEAHQLNKLETMPAEFERTCGTTLEKPTYEPVVNGMTGLSPSPGRRSKDKNSFSYYPTSAQVALPHKEDALPVEHAAVQQQHDQLVEPNNKHSMTWKTADGHALPSNPNETKLFEIVADKRFNDLEFFNQLVLVGQSRPLSDIVNNEGLNCLHMCLEHNRGSYLGFVHMTGHWVTLTTARAKGSSEYAGSTPREYAERKRFRRLVRQMDGLDNHEKSMGDQNSALKFCRAGDLSGLKNAVNSGTVGKNPRDSEGNGLLHWACVSGNLELTKYVVDELEASPRSQNNKMQNALHIAVMCGRSNLIDFLLTVCRLDPREIDSSMSTPTFKAAENGDEGMLRQLHEANVPFDYNIITRATKSGSVAAVRYLLEELSMDHATTDTDGKNLLMLAAESGHLNMLKYLVNKHIISFDALSKQNRNVLHYAADRGHRDVVTYLIRCIPRPELLQILNQKDKHKLEQDFSLVRGLDGGRPAWHYICLKRRYLFLYETCTKNGRVDASKVGIIVKSGWGDEPGVSVLREAVQDYRDMARRSDGEDDLTPLMLALLKGHSAVALDLLSAGADATVTDCFHQTSMHLAAMRGLVDVAQQLEKKHVPLNKQDADGFTPLRVAKENEHSDMAKLLSDNDMSKVHTFTKESIGKVKAQLAVEELRKIRRSGRDVRRHIIDIVRDLQIDVNILLVELGSGPVLEETTM